ncbi:MAG: BON domain-containing protein [Nitrospirota bacterium]
MTAMERKSAAGTSISYLFQTRGYGALSLVVTLCFHFVIFLWPMNVNAMGPSVSIEDIKQNQISDKEITSAIERDMENDQAVSAHLIDVKTNDGIVTLSGDIDNLLARDRAISITESIRGVRSIINRISVHSPLNSDNEIQTNIQNMLITDPVTDGLAIRVDVKNGIVTMSGTADSFAENQIAMQIAKSVRGVKDVQNRIKVRSKVERLDSEMKSEIEHRLALDPYVDSHLMNVEVKNGKVTLTGVVGSLAEKTRAYSDAWVSGVKAVNFENLNVEWWARNTMKRENQFVPKNDKELQKAVSDALLYDPRVATSDVSVVVKNHVVTLSGTVTSLQAKRAAEADALNTIGVWNVKNSIKVRPPDLSTNSKLKKLVIEALKRDPFIERHDLRVAVLNNKVYLYGTVDKSFEKFHASSIAERIRGVVEVENRIKLIHPWVWRSDETIKRAIEEELLWDAFVNEEDIKVEVENGVATLSGIVESIQIKNAAIENAFDGGARAVHSQLKIMGAPGYFREYFDRDTYMSGS